MEATTKNVRIIHTNLFTDKAFEACDSVLGQLSDGWGENNPVMTATGCMPGSNASPMVR